jgi:hypothetical protein
MKIKFRAEVWKETLLFQVLEMDEKFRKRGNTFSIKEDDRTFNKVSSAAYPVIRPDSKTVYLWGELQECDTKHTSYTFVSETQAQIARLDLIYILKQWSKNWKGFTEEPLPASNIIEF